MMTMWGLAIACAITALVWSGRASAGDWPQWGGRPDRNMVSNETGLADWFECGAEKDGAVNASAQRNIRWSVPLGSRVYGTPVVAGGRIFVGTNNSPPRDPKYDGDRSALLCLDEKAGKLLWQLVTLKGQYRLLGMCSPPTVEGDRLYLLTSRSEVLCLDVKGLADGNDGPFTDEATYLAKPARGRPTTKPAVPFRLGPTDADIIWRFDCVAELKARPHDTANCAALIVGDYVYIGTSNNIDNPKRRKPNSTVPDLIVLDKRTGQLLAVDDAPIMKRLFHGQWSSPSMGVVNGRTLIFYGGGDGICYAFDASFTPGADGKPGALKRVWWFDCNPPEYLTRDGKGIPYRAKGDGPSEIIATPVFYKNRVYVAIGQDPSHRQGKGSLSCIDATKTGDVTETGRVWQYKDVDRSMTTVAIADGLVYLGDRAGTVHCLDADTGKPYWTHMTRSDIWASPLVADGKVYVGSSNGRLWIFAAAKEKKILNTMRVRHAIHASPVAANGVLYVPSYRRLYAVKAGLHARPSEPTTKQ